MNVDIMFFKGTPQIQFICNTIAVLLGKSCTIYNTVQSQRRQINFRHIVKESAFRQVLNVDLLIQIISNCGLFKWYLWLRSRNFCSLVWKDYNQITFSFQLYRMTVFQTLIDSRIPEMSPVHSLPICCLTH